MEASLLRDCIAWGNYYKVITRYNRAEVSGKN